MNPLAVLGFLKAHPTLGSAAGALLLGLGAGAFLHAKFHPCAPAISESDHKEAASTQASNTTQHAGPKTGVVVNFDPAPGRPAEIVKVPGVAAPIAVPAGERIESVTLDSEGPVDTTTNTATSASSVEDHRLTITPQGQAPGWGLSVGIDGLTSRTLRVGARRRLLGPFWAEASVIPSTKTVGVGIAVEW